MNQTKQHKRYFRWLPLLAVVLAAAGCTSEEREVTEKSLTNSPVTLGFTLHLPEDSTSTRAMTGTEEKEIKSLAVLVFKETAPGVEVFDDKISVAPSSISASGRFEVPVKILSERQRFVLIANASDQIDRLSAAGQAKADVLQALVVKETGKWNAVSASTYRPMPMWGETGLLTISAPGQSAGTIYLHRMLAKINITIDPSILPSTFTLEEVYLYNRNTRGRLVPDAANWDPTTNNGQATAATLPPDTDPADPLTVHSHKTAWKYDNADGLTPTAINNAIYLFETKADNTDRLKTFALVVGGKYNGATTTTYYRLDIKEVTTRNYIDLLRNHNYRVTIDAVNGGGATDPDDAFKGEITLGASVNVWNNASPGDLIDNGQYMLSLSQMKYELSRDARTATDDDNKLIITTDYVNADTPSKSGWTATVWADEAGTTPVPDDPITNIPWIRLSQTAGTGNYPAGNQVYFEMEENTSGVRTAWVHITAGRLITKVEVRQQVVYAIYPAPHRGWAGSNIYWDGTKLTFDDTDDTTHENYQGVFFQWGSLWGIAPINEGDIFADNLYATVYPTRTEKVLWTSIPRVDDINIPADRNRAYLQEIHNPSNNIGDVCRYLTEQAGGTLHGKKWRMPTSNEFESASNYTKFGSFDPWYGNATGTFGFLSGYRRDNTFFPASGYRYYLSGWLYQVGMDGAYWSASPNGAHGYCMFLREYDIHLNTYTYRAFGFPVRCVQE